MLEVFKTQKLKTEKNLFLNFLVDLCTKMYRIKFLVPFKIVSNKIVPKKLITQIIFEIFIFLPTFLKISQNFYFIKKVKLSLSTPKSPFFKPFYYH